jgi:chemotaxis protein histidine kinase CheA
MESAHAAKTKELETKISETKTNQESETKELKTKVSTLSAQTNEQNKHKAHAAQLKQLKEQRAALEAKLKTEMEKASAKAADYEIKVTELKSSTKELRTKVSAAHSKEKEAVAKINTLKQTVASKPAQTSSASNTHDSTEVPKKVGSQMEGCTLVGDNAVNTTGFSIINKHNLAVMGKDIDSRTCVLRGVVKFTSDGNTATAWLDPNYRDPDTEMPLCFPVSGTMQFFASVVNPKDPFEIERTVGLQIEPHGRLVIVGKQSSDVMVRLDNILYHPLIKFMDAPETCAPYCFPTSKLGEKGVAVSGCVKYCTPTQYVRQSDTSLVPSPCRCTMLKRLDCFKRNGQADIVCGQFKRLLETSDIKGNPTDKCEQICAGQLVAF